MSLKGKHIILGVSGGIAAYKAAILIRLLVKSGASVKVIMTPMAKHFITPLTLATLSKNAILTDFYNPENGDWNSHVDLGIWADLLIIAPATANTLGKMSNGIADNLLLTTYFSAKCPVMIAPAMDLDMFLHPITQRNITNLQSIGNIIIEPGFGELASGLEGKGRMEEPEKILESIKHFFLSKKGDLAGKKIMVTAGPTHEKIDPVRFIGNHSSGKMGYAIADELHERGAEVILVSGPVTVHLKSDISIIQVNSAAEMFQSCQEIFPTVDAGILCAAVADYTVEHPATVKIKREKEDLNLILKPTQDIAAYLGKMKKPGQILVGFALETTDELENACKKRIKKNFNFIVLNSLNDPGSGFQTDTNQVTIIDEYNIIERTPLKSKTLIAKDIVDKLATYLRS